MADLRCLHPLRVCAVMAALIAPLAATGQVPDDVKDLRSRLHAVETRTPDAGIGPVDVPALRIELGLDVAEARPAAAAGVGTGLFGLQNALAAPAAPDVSAPVEIETTNFRLMLATLVQGYSARNNALLVNAQGARGPLALSVRSGTVSLSDLQTFSAAQGHPPRTDGSLTLPVLLWPDAKLVITRGERLAMARDAGAFILSMGRIEIDGALIEVTGPENVNEATFNPFITVAGTGSLSLKNATVHGLGFGRTSKFAGITVAGNPLMPPRESIEVRDNLFDGHKVLTIAGVTGAQVTGNTFRNARSNALSLQTVTDAVVTGNLFHGTSPTNAIRVQQGSDNVLVEKNIVLSGDRVAVLIDGGSTRVSLRDNLVWGRDGAGFKFLNTRCGRAEGNILIDNQQKGIEVRKSDGIVLQNNLIVGNRSAGIWVSAQAEGARTAISDNRFVGNGAGLSAATGADIWLAGNNFTQQLPKLLDGDIAAQTNALVRDLEGSGPLEFTHGTVRPHAALADLCGGGT